MLEGEEIENSNESGSDEGSSFKPVVIPNSAT